MASKGVHHNNQLNYSYVELWHLARPLQTAECVWKWTHSHIYIQYKREYGMTIRGDMEGGSSTRSVLSLSPCVCECEAAAMWSVEVGGIKLVVFGVDFPHNSLVLRLRPTNKRPAHRETGSRWGFERRRRWPRGAVPKTRSQREQPRFLNSHAACSTPCCESV